MRELSGTLAAGRQQTFELQVEPGTEYLVAGVRSEGAAPADVDLYLFDCTAGPCSPPLNRSRGGGSREQVRIESPRPGRWLAVVDGSAAPGEKAFRYFDFLAHPRLGALVTDDAALPRAAGARWTARWHAWPAARPAKGRRIAGALWIEDAQLRQFNDFMPSWKLMRLVPYRETAIPLDLTFIEEAFPQ